MNWLTRVFLVLLRLAIGWHFFFEGVGKLPPESWPVQALSHRHPARTRDLAAKPPFGSENYLRESAGPFGANFRGLAGDPVVERMTLTEVPSGEDPARKPANRRLSPALERDWDGYFQRFVQHYHLSDVPLPYQSVWMTSPQAGPVAGLPWDGLFQCGAGGADLPNQRRLAETKLKQMKYQTAIWLMQGKKAVQREGPNSPPVEIERTTPERIKEYQDQLQVVRKLQDRQMALFGPDVNARLREAKAKANKMRAELKSDLDRQTLIMKLELHQLLTEDQKREPLPEVISDRPTAPEMVSGQEPLEPKYDPSSWKYEPGTQRPAVRTRPAAPADPIQADFRSMTALEKIDWTTRWGVFLVGACLLLGLFSRTACVVGAGFLLMFYLSMPPLPGLPDNPRVEGTYLYINKNFIEMLALLTLATTASGRWVGLDGLLYCLNPFRWGRAPRKNAPLDSDREQPEFTPPPPPPPIPVDLGRDTPRPDLFPEPPPPPAPEKERLEPVTVTLHPDSPKDSANGN